MGKPAYDEPRAGQVEYAVADPAHAYQYQGAVEAAVEELADANTYAAPRDTFA